MKEKSPEEKREISEICRRKREIIAEKPAKTKQEIAEIYRSQKDRIQENLDNNIDTPWTNILCKLAEEFGSIAVKGLCKKLGLKELHDDYEKKLAAPMRGGIYHASTKELSIAKARFIWDESLNVFYINEDYGLVHKKDSWESKNKRELPNRQETKAVVHGENVVREALVMTDQANIPLNQILYGPPGTGKTYKTTELAVEIADPGWYADQDKSDLKAWRKVVKNRYLELVKERRIAFTTFHQSFSYEDFIEGIRASTGKNGQLQYEVENGVFKKLCTRARFEILKMSMRRRRNEQKFHLESAEQLKLPNPELSAPKPCILIIDEINRGNISRIFGELITLLEPSKRAGGDDKQSVILPYSKKRFSVPNNVYVIGTMNTADRSLAQLDLALRRRFSFVEVLPEPELLSGVSVYGIDLEELLEVINQRIEAILDSDHMIGHSYFMPLLDAENETRRETLLAEIFRNNIIPLLREYFFDDYERIGWVLNNSKKRGAVNFIEMGASTDLSKIGDLFPKVIADQIADRRFRINEEAFTSAAAFRGILGYKSEEPEEESDDSTNEDD